MAGLLDFGETEEEKQSNRGLLAAMAGLGILSSNRPGVSPSQALGQGGLAGMQGFAQQQQLAQQAKQQKMLMDYRNAMMAKTEQPNSIKEYEYAKQNGFQGSFEDYRRGSMAENRGAAQIQNYERRQQLVKEYGEDSREVRTFDAYVRQMPYLNTGPAFVQPQIGVPGQAAGSIATGLKPGEEPAVRNAQAQATSAGTVQGSTQATAAVNLPQTIAQADDTVKLVEDLVKHPGLSGIVGAPESVSGVANMVLGAPIPGTKEADFRARLDQLSGKQFLQAYETLKGGGVITEIEGAKATDAISRMQKTGQTEAEFKKAAQEYIDIVRAATNRAKLKAGAAPKSAGGATGSWSIK